MASNPFKFGGKDHVGAGPSLDEVAHHASLRLLAALVLELSGRITREQFLSFVGCTDKQYEETIDMVEHAIKPKIMEGRKLLG